jgi:hypothetical protein
MFIYFSNVCQKQCSQIRDIIIYWLNMYVEQKAPVTVSTTSRKTWGTILTPHIVYKQVDRGFVSVYIYGQRIRVFRGLFFNKTATLCSV